MTIKEHIFELLHQHTEGLTCIEIANHIPKENKYAPGIKATVSSILAKLVKDKIIFVHPVEEGPKGGKVYISKQIV